MSITGKRMAGATGAQDMINRLSAESVEKEEAQQKEDVSTSTFAKKSPTLKDLLFLGKSKSTITVGDYVFDIASLTAEDQKFLMVEAMKQPLDQRAFLVRIFGLALSISKVNGVPLEDLYEGQSRLTPFEKRVEILSAMQLSLIELLSEGHEKILRESAEELRPKEALEEVKK